MGFPNFPGTFQLENMFKYQPVLPLKSLAAIRCLDLSVPSHTLPTPLQPLAEGKMEGRWLKWREEEEWQLEDGRNVTVEDVVEVERRRVRDFLGKYTCQN